VRISTAQIFDSGTRGIGRNQSDLYRLQNQMSSGRKILTPADDPVASSQALILTQSKEVSAQFLRNQDTVKGQLGVVDAQLTALDDLMQNVRDKVVQAGNTTLSNADRGVIVKDLEASFSQLMGLANAQDGTGSYLFSGYQGSVKPFSVSDTGANYAGDDGQRLVQVDASRQMAGNIPGSELFEKIRNGNGTFVTSNGGNVFEWDQSRSAIIDKGNVNNQALWNQAINSPGFSDVSIRFFVDAGVTSYRLYDQAGTEISTTASTPAPGLPFPPPNGVIPINKTTTTPLPAQDFGVSVVVQGAPADGDRFVISPSTDQSIFTTLRNTINTISQGISTSAGTTSTEFTNNLSADLVNIDQAMGNVLNVRTTVGSRLNEIESLSDSSADLQLQYAASLSSLQDLDYAKAISEMAQKQLQLEAAQLSFKQISQLSLFSIL
jgi:flagellar hook-associated protein 3 FlgL